MAQQGQEFDFEDVKKVIGGSPIWVILALVVVGAVVATTLRIGRVSGSEVGILLNKLNGKTTVISQSGVRIYNGITSDFFVLDKTLQTIEMSERTKDPVKIKTNDGSDVYVELKVQFRIDPAQADVVLATSGRGDAFKQKWAWDYTRTIGRNFLGELTTEEFYDASKRAAKIALAKNNANERLAAYGIKIDDIVIPTKPRFYTEYEAMIKKKKLADQVVLEEEAKATAAEWKKETFRVEETNKKNVAVEEFSGQMEQKTIKAKAEGERVRKAALAYYDKITIGAEATLYERKRTADGILAKKKAEAKGIEKLKQALEGPGGRNMVKMEYARKLKGITITGKPFTLEAHTARFEHSEAAAAGAGTKSGRAR